MSEPKFQENPRKKNSKIRYHKLDTENGKSMFQNYENFFIYNV